MRQTTIETPPAAPAPDPYVRLARWYDLLLGPVLDPLREAVCDLARDGGSRRVVDLCCGTGRQAAMLADAGCQVVGVDRSPAMIAQARLNRPDLDFRLADAAAAPLPTGAFDLCVISLALHEMPPASRDGVLTEAKRLIGEGGRIIVVDYVMPRDLPERCVHLLMRLPERLAGREHYRNYLDFMRRRALYALLVRHQLLVRKRESFFWGAAGLALCVPA